MSPEIVTRRARADHLLSKLIAGGLSAGVVLLWWPRVVPHDSAASWVARGIGWTLLTEILVVALSPLELLLRTRLAACAPVNRLRGMGSRFRHVAYVALVALAVCHPLTLIATGGPAPAPQPPKQVTNVTRVVKVVKPVQVKKIVVRRETAPAPVYVPAPAAGTPAATPRTAAMSKRPESHKRSSSKRTAQSERSAADKPSARAMPSPTPDATATPATPTPAPGN